MVHGLLHPGLEPCSGTGAALGLHPSGFVQIQVHAADTGDMGFCKPGRFPLVAYGAFRSHPTLRPSIPLVRGTRCPLTPGSWRCLLFPDDLQRFSFPFFLLEKK